MSDRMFHPNSLGGLRRQIHDLEAENERLRAALDAILALPSEHDLLYNAMARALYEIALAARDGDAT